jgi:hypothetical protein
VSVTKPGHVLIGAGWGVDDRFDVEGYQHLVSFLHSYSKGKITQ